MYQISSWLHGVAVGFCESLGSMVLLWASTDGPSTLLRHHAYMEAVLITTGVIGRADHISHDLASPRPAFGSPRLVLECLASRPRSNLAVTHAGRCSFESEDA